MKVLLKASEELKVVRLGAALAAICADPERTPRSQVVRGKLQQNDPMPDNLPPLKPSPLNDCEWIRIGPSRSQTVSWKLEEM